MRPLLQGNRRKVITLTLLVGLILGATFVFAPVQSIAAVRQALATRLSASPTAKRLMSITPAPVRALVRRQFEPVEVTTRAAAEPIALVSATSVSSSLVEPAGPVAITSFTQSVSPNPACAGDTQPMGNQTVDYVFTVTNDATADTNVSFGVTLPAGFQIVQTNVAGFGAFGACNPNGTNVKSCTGGSLAASAVGTLGLSVFIPANTPPGTYSPIVPATYVSTETPATQATGSADVTVQQCADLGITKATGNNTPVAGGPAFSYTLVVSNNGPSAAADVVVTDPLPASIIFQNLAVVNATGGNLICVGPAVGANGPITCTSGSYPAGGTSTVTITAQVVANTASGVRTNTATVGSATPEPVPSEFPNTASVVQNIVATAPLSINKTGPSTVCAGDTFTYHLTVNNAGPSTALNASISDPLPANTTFLSQSGTGAFAGTCSHNGGTPGIVACSAVDIPSGLSTLDITVKLAPGAPAGPLANTATITTAGTGTIAVGASTTTATVSHCIDMQVTKTASPNPVAPGQNLTYTILVENLGPSDAAAGEITVNEAAFPPGGTTLVGVINAPGFGCNAGVVFPCTNGAPLPAGASVSIQFQVNIPANFVGGALSNTATVVANAPNAVDTNGNNNASTVTTQVVPNADLAITKQAETLAGAAFGASVTAGGTTGDVPLPPPATGAVTGTGEILYTLDYRNNGPSDAVNVHIRDVVPGGTLLIPSFVAPTITQSGTPVTCSVGLVLGIPSPTYQLDCTPATGGILPAGASGRVQFRVRVPENVAAGTVIRNQATINSEGATPPQLQSGGGGFLAYAASLAQQIPATPDPSGGNNTSLETQNVVRTLADLEITKTGPPAVLAGQPITYVLTVTNLGVSDARDIVVRDVLPAGVNFVSAISSDPDVSCVPAGPTAAPVTVTCQSALLAAPPLNPPPIIPPRNENTSFTITIVGQVNPNFPPVIINNTATVESSTEDPVLANNTSNTVATTVGSEATIVVNKTDSPDPVVAGTNLTYTIAVQNQGPSVARNVVVSDPLPPDTTFVSVAGQGPFALPGVCTHNGAVPGVVTCQTPPPGIIVPPGAPFLITVVVKVDSDHPGTPISNTVTVTWDNAPAGEPGPSPATDTETTSVIRVADLVLDKQGPSIGVAGFSIDHTIQVTNLGPSDVFGGPTPGSVVVTDTLPVGATFTSYTATGVGGFVCSAALNVVTCLNAANAAGNIPVGGIATIVVKSTIPPGAGAGTNYCNTATVVINPAVHPDPDATDPNSANNTDQSCAVVTSSADLSTAKTSTPVVDPDGAGPLPAVPLPVVGPNVPPGAVSAGGYLQYDVPFGNAGPSDAINVLLSNVVPANTAFVGAFATGGVFVPAAQPPAVPFSFVIEATDGPVLTGPPLSLTCTVIGGAGTQQIFCRPQGNGALLPPTADGTLPPGYSGVLTFFVKVNESVTGGTIITDPAIITSGLCPNGVGPVPPPFPPVPCAGTPDPNVSNNTSQTTQNVVVAASNLQITKIVQSGVTAASSPNQTGPIGPATAPNGAGLTGTAVIPGTVMTYRLVITNNGPSDVSNIRVTDVLPSGLETPPGRVLGVKYVSATPVIPSGATFTCNPPTGINPANNPQGNGGSIVCTAPSLAANAPNNTAAIDITVFIDPATRANLVNAATVDATINNFNRPVSGTALLTTPVAPQADVALSKTYTPNPVIAGLPFTYTIVLTNNGQSTATSVVMTDTFPPFQKVTNIAIQTTPNGNGAPNFTCVTVPVLGSPGNTTSMTCTAPELPPNKNADNTNNPSGTVTFVLTMLQDQLTPQPLPIPYQNCLTSTSATTDPIPANNTNVCIPVNVIFQADPDTETLEKTDTPDPVIAGNLLTYTIRGINNGPSAALDYRITDPLPLGTVFLSAVASPGATLVTPAVGTNGVVSATWDAAGGTPGGLTGVGVVRTLTIVVRVCPDVVCGTLSNTATSSSLTPNGRVDNDSFTATTTVQAQSDLSITKTDSPDPAKPSFGVTDQFVTYTINFANAGPSNSANTIITDVLPAGFTVFGTPTSTVPGTIFSQSVGGPQGDQITVTAELGVLGAPNQCNAPPRPTSGTIVIVARVPNKFPNVTVTNTATITSGNCLPDPNPANNTAIATTVISEEPQVGSAGLGFPAEAEASDDKSGSVLFWPLYTSNASTPALQNTSISLANKSIFDSATVHLFVVDGTTCSAQDVYICLTPNQTVSFLASDFDPGVTGYIVAIAVNINTGRPVSLNCLMGDAFVKFASGHRASYGAVAVSTVLNNPTGVDPLATSAVLRFDGLSYNRLPRILAVDGIPAIGDGNSTMLSLMAVGGNMSLSGATIGSLTGNMFDDRENNFSFNEPAPRCQFTQIMTDSFPRTFTPFSGLVLPGHTGWMKIRAFQDIAILGVMLNVNSNAATAGNAFNNGHGLHGLTLTGNSTLTIPVDIPECH